MIGVEPYGDCLAINKWHIPEKFNYFLSKGFSQLKIQ